LHSSNQPREEEKVTAYILGFLRFPLHIIIPWRWVGLAGCGIELSVYWRIEKERRLWMGFGLHLI
jgi:hypothetical protein